MNITDERQNLINRICMHFSERVDDLEMLRSELYITLNDYEITNRCTEVAETDRECLENVLKRFLVAKAVKGCTERTIQLYSMSVRKVFAEINKRVEDVTPDDIRLYIGLRLRRDGVSKVTVGNEIRSLSSFYAWATAEEIIQKNPMLRVHKIKKQKVRKEALTEMEIERLRMAADGEMQKMMIEVLLSTGCRVTELVNIRIDEIQKDEITVHGKGEKDRKVYLNAKAELAVQVYLAKRRDENPYLLPGAKSLRERKGRDRKESRKNWWMDRNNLTEGHITTSAVESTMREIADRAEVEKANPHKFRRTCATLALRRGMPIEQVSRMLGHEEVGTTQIYLDLKEEDLKRSHEKYVV